MSKIFKCLLFFGFLAGHTHAADLVWTNTAGGNWATAANWSPNQVPTSADNAFITNSGSYTVTVNSAAQVASLRLGGGTSTQTMTLTSTLTVGAASRVETNGVFNFNSGTLNGAGDITVAGTLNWNNGTMSGAGQTIILVGGKLNIGTTTHDLLRTIVNGGETTWTGGALQMNGGTFNNNAIFTFDSAAGLSCYGTGGANVFNNSGLFNKLGTGAATFQVSSTGVTFNNNTGAMVDIQLGALNWNSGGTNDGTVTIPTGTSLGLAGNFGHGPSLYAVGGGIISFNSGTHTIAAGAEIKTENVNITGSTVNFAGGITLQKLNLSGGALGGAGDVNVAGALVWSAGDMNAGGKTVVTNGATLTINNTTHDLRRVLQNNGTATWTAGAIQMNAGTINNNGSFTVTNASGTLQAYGVGGANVFNNTGNFVKQGAGTVNILTSSTGVEFNNTGLVDVQGGALGTTSGGSNSSSIVLAAGTALNLAGNINHALSSSINGAGSVTISSGTHSFAVGAQINAAEVTITGGTTTFAGNVSLAELTFSGGTLNGAGNVTVAGALVWGSGTMSGTGRTIVANTGTLTINNTTHDLYRTLENNGVATWTAGAMQMNGGTIINNGSFTAGASGTLQAYGVGGVNVFTNAGSFIKQGAGDLNFTVSSTAAAFNNSGTVDVQTGELALVGGGTHSGDFTVGAGRTLRFSGTHTMAASSEITGAGTFSVSGGTLTDAGPVDIGSTAFSGGTLTFNNTFAGGSSLSISGGTVNFNGVTTFANGATMNLSGGTLAGSGDITVTGAFSWSGGDMAGSGKTIIANGATLSMNTTTHDLRRTLENNGSATWTLGALQMNGGTFVNNGSLTATNNALLQSYGTGGVNVFTNAGTFIKKGTGVIEFTVSSTTVPFNNGGAVDLQAGTISINAGGIHAGDFAVGSGATLRFQSSQTLSAGADITGAGNFVVNGGTSTDAGNVTVGSSTFSNGTITFNGSYSGGLALTVSGGSVAFNGTTTFSPGADILLSNGTLGGSANLSFDGEVTWSGGDMAGSGRTIITSAGTLVMNNTTRNLNRVLENNGTATWTLGAFQMNGGTFINNASFTADSTTALSCYGVGGVNVFTNAGTFTKQGASSASFFVSSTAVSFQNGGTVNVPAGQLVFNGGFNQSGGQFNLTGGSVAANSTMQFAGGVLGGSGTVAANVNNSGGILAPGASPGQLTITGNYTQGAGGAMNIELQGTAPGTGFDKVAVSGTATLGGTLNLTFLNGFVPATSSSYTFLTASPRSGSFSTFNFPAATVSMQLNYSSASATVQESTIPFTPTIFWVGGSGDWNAATNWNTGAVPGPTDDILINVNGDVVVTHSSGNHTSRSLFSQNAIVLSGGSLTITNTLQANNGMTISGGALRKATVMPSAGGQGIVAVNSFGVLDEITLNGELDVGRSDNGAGITITNGLTLNGTIHIGNTTNQFWGQLAFAGTQTLAGTGTVIFGNQGICNSMRLQHGDTALTIGQGVTVRGHSGQIGQSTSCIGSPVNVHVINQGTISADVAGGTLVTHGQDFVNQGMLEARNGGHLNLHNLVGNVGTVSLLSGSTLTMAGAYTNNLTLNLTNNATLNLNGTWLNTGVINSTNSTVNLGGDFTLAALGALNRTGGSVNLRGVMDAQGGTLVLSAATGSWNVFGGTLKNGTVSASGGAQLVFDSGTLDAVTVNGELNVGSQINGGTMVVRNGLVLNGTIHVGNSTNSNWGQVGFVGTQTLSGNGTLIFGNQGVCNSIRVDTAGTTLTIAPSILIRGHSGQIGQSTSCIGTPANVQVINRGTISADVAGGTIVTHGQEFVNQGTLESRNGGHLNLHNLNGNLGAVSLLTGSTLTVAGNYTNNLTLSLSTNAVVNLNGNWANTGTINMTNATLNLGGTFTLAGVGAINRVGGSVNVTGTLNAEGGTVALNAATGSWLLNGGTLRNGTLNNSGGSQLLVSDGTLDAMTVNGDLDVGRLVNGATLKIFNGLTLNGTLYIGHPSNFNWGQVGFVGSQTFGGNGTVIFGNQGSCNALRVDTAATVLTFAPTITIRGHSGQIGQSTSCIGTPANVAVVNQGTISADVTGGTINILAQSFTNQAVAQALAGTTLTFNRLQNLAGGQVISSNATITLNGNWANAGIINATNSTVNLAGISSQIGNFSALNSTLNVNGAYDSTQIELISYSPGRVRINNGGSIDNTGHTLVLNDQTGSWLLNGGALRKGTVSGSGAGRFVVSGGTFDEVTVNGEIDVGREVNGAVLGVINGLVLNGAAHVGNPTNQNWGQIAFVGTQTVGGNGSIIFGNQGLCNAVRIETVDTTLTIGSGITIRGHSGQIGQSTQCYGTPANVNLVNLGTIMSEFGAGTIHIRSQNFTNQGVVEARLGRVEFFGPHTLAGGTIGVGISSQTSFGRLDFNNALAMAGTFRARFNGVYRPEGGTAFSVLEYPSRTGNFDGLNLPADVQWQTAIGAAELIITGTALEAMPSIVTGPQSQSIIVGNQATFAVSALGTQPLVYQWRRNGTNLLDGGRISGSQTDTLVIANVIPADAGEFRVFITNLNGNASSDIATLSALCVISASNNPAGAGNIVGIGVFAAGGTNTVTATARPGYKFANWTENGVVLTTNLSLVTVLTTNHVYVANYDEANPLHVVTTATLPAALATIPGAGSYTNGQIFEFTAPGSITNPPNLYTFREWRGNGAFVSSNVAFSKTFSTVDPTNLAFVAHYNAATILPLVTNVTLNFAQPVPATTNLLISVRFNRAMDTNFPPLVVLSNAAIGSVQPVVAPNGTWSSLAAANDTYTPPPITLTTGMDGTNQVIVSLARDLSGGTMALTNALAVRVDVTAPAAPTISLVSSNSSSATVSWAGYAAPADVASFRVYLSPTNFTSVAGRAPVSGVGGAIRQFTYSGLALDTPYFAAVAAVDTAGNSSLTVTPLSFSLPSSIPQPVSIQALAVGPSSANVTWSGYDVSGLFGFAGFKIYYETAPFTSVAGLTPKLTVGAGARSALVENLDRTRVYHFAVVGFNGNDGFNPNVTTASWSDPLAGNIGVNMTVGGAGQVVDILQSVTVINNAVVTVAAGTTIRFAAGAGLTIQQGALNANGTALDPIVFTSAKDQAGQTPAAGDWVGIALNGGAGSSVLRHVLVNYANGLTVSNCAPTVEAFTAQHNSGAGLNLAGSATLTTADALLVFNQFGARQANAAALNIRNSVIKNNGTNAQAAGTASLMATQNWWGSAISAQIDVTIDGDVPHTNFLASEPLLTPAIGTSNNITQTGSRLVNLRLASRTAEAMRLSEDSTFTGVFFTPFTNATTFQLSEGGGSKTVFAQFRSITGQQSPPVSVTINYITDGPTIGTFSLTEGLTLSRPVTVTGSASAPLGMAGIEFYVDNAPLATNVGGSFSYRFDLRNITAGVHRVKLLARDTAGNFATLERNVLITPTPPAPPLISNPATDIAVSTSSIQVAGTAEALVEVRLFRAGTILGVTNASAAGTFNFQNVPLIEGANEFTAVAIDPLGNASSAIRTVMRDTVPPVALILDPPVYTYGTGLRLTWRFPATGKRATAFQVFWHTAPITSTNQATGRSIRTPGSQVTVQGLATATYYFYVMGFDDVGNASPLSVPVQYLFDAAPPTFTVAYDKPSPAGVGPLRVTITASEPVGATPSTTVTLNGGPAALFPLTNISVNTYEGVLNVNSTMASGPVAFNVSAADLAGNPFNGPPTGPAMVIDLRPPSGVITTLPLPPVQATNDTNVTVTLQLTETPKVGTTPTLNFAPPFGPQIPVIMGGGGTNWTGTLTITPQMGSGVGHFTLTVNDALDNVGHSITAGSSLEIYNTALPSAPAQPVGFQAVSLSGGRVQLGWLSVSNAEIYRVYAEAGSTLVAPTTLVADNVTSNGYTHLPATDGSYRYVVRALRRGSEGTNSIVRVANSDRTPPPAPTGLALQLVASGLKISWQPGAGEAAHHYNLYRNGTFIRTISSGVTNTIDTPPRGIMNYAVAAADVLDNEAASAPATIELLVGAVANLQALVSNGGAPVLTWVSGDNTGVAYNVYRNGIKQNAAPVAGTMFTDSLPAAGAAVTYAVTALNSTNAESVARTVEVHSVGLDLVMNPFAGGSQPPTGRYFDNYRVGVSNLTSAGSLPLRQLEIRRTSTAGPLNITSQAGIPILAGNGISRDLAVPCATNNAAQTVRLRAVQETDVGGSSVIYERSFDFPTVQAPGVMMEVSANQLPLAGGLNSFDVRIFNRGYTTMYFAASRGNGADPGDLAIVVRNTQGQEVSRQRFAGSPPGVIFSGGVGYVSVAPGGSTSITVPGVLVPEALAGSIVTFDAVASAIYDRFTTDGQQQSGPLSGSMQSSLQQTPYFGSAQTDSPTYSNDQPIVVSGQALDRVSNLPRANVPLKIGFATRGYRWYRDVTTDSQGNYSYSYQPNAGLAGSLTIWAAHPDVVDQLNQAQVTIYRLYPSPASGDIRMSKNDTLGFTMALFNPGDTPLSNFTVDVDLFELQGTNRVPTTKVTGTMTTETNFVVAAGQRQPVHLSLTAAPDAPNNVIAVYTFTSSEGAMAEFTANVTLLAAVPIITVVSPDVGYVDVAVDRGTLLSRPVTIVNRGLKDLQGVSLLSPTNETWMVVNLPKGPDGSIPLPDLRVGETNVFTVVFAPSTNVALGFHQDKVVIRGTNSQATFDVNLFARVASDQLGAVQFYVDNILGADVPNATVRLRNTALQVELPPVQTAINGLVTVTNLQEGDWSWQITAPGHSANVGVVSVIPGQTVQVATRLNKSVVSVNFSVVPVPFTDRYEIRLEQTFETHVPVPVMVITPTYMEFNNVNPGFEASYIVTIKNEGLIQMENLTISGSHSAVATMTPLITYAPVLLPQQTIEIPMHVTYSGASGPTQQENPLTDCLPNPLDFMDQIEPFTAGLAALANAEGRCIKDNTALMIAGATAMAMKIIGDVTGVLADAAEQVASYIGCVLGSLLADLGGGFSGGSSSGNGQQSLQNFTPTGNGCFAAETRILLADGTSKRIPEIKVGDFVKTGTGRNDAAHVAEVYELTSDKARTLQFTWSGSERTDYLRTTDEHMFWVDGKGWVEARALRVGDWLVDDAARLVRVTKNERIAEPMRVYTFRLREDPAFYANGILVHDMCGFWSPEQALNQSPPDGPPPGSTASLTKGGN